MSGRAPNRTSFQPGTSGNPGGRPASAEVSALARRYTPDAIRGLVEVVRLPVVTKNASAIVSAAAKLIDIGHPGLAKAAPELPTDVRHLHLLAVSQEAQTLLRNLPSGGVSAPTLDAEAWGESGTAESVDLRTLPRPDSRLPHEALPLWDAAPEPQEGNRGAEPGNGEETPQGPDERG